MFGLAEALKKLRREDLQGRLMAMIFGIRAHDVKSGVEGSRVIHPTSAFNKGSVNVCSILKHLSILSLGPCESFVNYESMTVWVSHWGL